MTGASSGRFYRQYRLLGRLSPTSRQVTGGVCYILHRFEDCAAHVHLPTTNVHLDHAKIKLTGLVIPRKNVFFAFSSFVQGVPRVIHIHSPISQRQMYSVFVGSYRLRRILILFPRSANRGDSR